MKVAITDQMKTRAAEEARRRDPHITHHFNVGHMTGEQRDVVGFVGEFACCEFLGINWESNIRANYLTIDTGDIQTNGLISDVKTETLPFDALQKVYNKTINDDEPWGRRLINENQVHLLHRYDIVIFGGVVREENYQEWYPFGYLETDYILNNYVVTNQRPYGGQYPYAALPIKTSELKDLNELLKK